MYIPCLFSQILHAPLLITTLVFHFPIFELHSFLLPVVTSILNIKSHTTYFLNISWYYIVQCRLRANNNYGKNLITTCTVYLQILL